VKLLNKLFGESPFDNLLNHTKKVHACLRLIRPLLEACIHENHGEIHRLQDIVSKLEHEADLLKHTIREHLPHQYLLPMDRSDVYRFLKNQDDIADLVQDFAVLLFIRKTPIHPSLVDDFLSFTDQIFMVSEIMMGAAEELQNLVKASFKGAQAKLILERVSGLDKEEWSADRMQRKLGQRIYELEEKLSPITIIFYEKILQTLSGIADTSENVGDILREMIMKKM
jgi:predicted phosphate transport protein (TIGR00153 family)